MEGVAAADVSHRGDDNSDCEHDLEWTAIKDWFTRLGFGFFQASTLDADVSYQA